MLASSQFFVTSFFPDELCEHLGLVPRYRGKQLFSVIYQGKMHWDEITVFPQDLRDRMTSLYPLISSKVLSFIQTVPIENLSLSL